MKYQCSICRKILSSAGHATRHVRTKYHFPLIQLIEKYHLDDNQNWVFDGWVENK